MNISLTSPSIVAMLYFSYCSRAAFSFQPSTRSFVTRSMSSFFSGKDSPLFSILLSSMKEEVDPGVVEGTDLRVLKYPHPSLRAPNTEITEAELADGSIAKIAKEMLLVMYAAEGCGLAAPQVGINKRLMVFNEAADKSKWLQEVVLVNPQIVEFSEAKAVEIEGCLSFPEMNGKVERSKWIKVEALNLKGKKMKKKFIGWEARIFQHEYDHLDGKVYIDRLDEEEKVIVAPRLKELVEEFGTGGTL
jgi:peptide deformylase